MKYTLTQRFSHFFHIVSNIRPIIWIGLYICAAPLFALVYWALPEGQFRIPDGDCTGYGSWLYYSIVTITTLGFGDFTPAHGAAQAVTAVEVMCGLIFLGLFLNAVGAMKSEIDVESEVEKQKQIHRTMEHQKLLNSVPMVIHSLNSFLSYCYAVTTPPEKRDSEDARYNPDFSLSDMKSMFLPSGLPSDRTNLPAVERLIHSASQTSLALDLLQQRVDLALWPGLMETCFSFVAQCQIFSNKDGVFRHPSHRAFKNPEEESMATQDLMNFIKITAELATKLETTLSEISLET